ncbi:unnamed protein product [Didymodactylos carnosus]|uniref:Uncharacterized protein n=1 Tax=Didymodactylos carnosus TaxID=1234261 RepID=A0A814R4K0_9BILA|nr:unnamed protein product [Didymodactylos carnosus]CAF1128839.1 unnamed protein product [Didymodactylos carnosus]CAF3674955.1 unnamed protein product [Didymodactylos carnosus]CAF3892437.1 unnamed protein product [Didymodactylos carnosus]
MKVRMATGKAMMVQMESPKLVKELGNYLADDRIRSEFFRNPVFCHSFKQCLNISVHIEVQEEGEQCDIRLVGEEEPVQLTRNKIKTLFEKLDRKIYNEGLITHWVDVPFAARVIQRSMESNRQFIVCEYDNDGNFVVYYFKTGPFKILESKLDKMITKGFLLDRISLPDKNTAKRLPREINDLLWKKANKVTLYSTEENEIQVFGPKLVVVQLKKQLEKLINKYQLKLFKINYLLTICLQELRDIEKEYADDCVDIINNIHNGEFLAPEYLKDQIEYRLGELILQFAAITYDYRAEICSTVVDREMVRLAATARRYHCRSEIEVQTFDKIFTIPKVTVDDNIEQSDVFYNSPLVFMKASVHNGSIEIHRGDLTAQKVNFIVVSSELLRDSVMKYTCDDRIQSEYLSAVDKIGEVNQLIETTAGNLSCGKILLLNRTPSFLVNDAQNYISECIQHITKDVKDSETKLSIAFEAPIKGDDVENKFIAETMINEAKRQLETTSAPLSILFVLSLDKQELYKHYSSKIQSLQTQQDGYAQFYYPTSSKDIWIYTRLDLTLLSQKD